MSSAYISGLLSTTVFISPKGVSQAVNKRPNISRIAPFIVPLPDTIPDPFNFTSASGVALTTLTTSAYVTPGGYDTSTTISVTGGEYQLGSGSWVSTPGVIIPGQQVRVRHTSSGSYSTPTVTTLTIGGVSATFTSTTAAAPADTVPDAFSFTSVSGAALSTEQDSSYITPTGYNAAATVTITGGEYQIETGAWGSASGSITPGQKIRVRHTSSGSYSTATNTTLTIGGVSATFTSTTAAAPADTVPDAFSFTDVNNVALSTQQVSNYVTPVGYNTPTSISITGGEYQLDSGAWTTASGTITPGQQVRVRHTSSASNSTATNTTLTIGGVADTFTSTTAAAVQVILALLSGQSNMPGRNSQDGLDTDVTDVFQWVPDSSNAAYHTLSADITPLLYSPDGLDRIGPGGTLLKQLKTDNPSAKIIGVPVAQGSTAMVGGASPAWAPAASGGGTLFELSISEANLAYAAAQAAYPGANIEVRIYFIQGEQDASLSVTRSAYATALTNAITYWRSRITGATNAKVFLGSMVPEKWMASDPNYSASYAPINQAHVDVSLSVAGVSYIKGPNYVSGTRDFLHYQPVDRARTMGTRLAAASTDVTGPNVTTAATYSNAVGSKLSFPLTGDDEHQTFHINGGAGAANFEISDPYLNPTLRWTGDGTGPAAGTYAVGVRARDGSGNYGPTKTITFTVSAEVSPTSFFTSGEKGMVWDLSDLSNLSQTKDGLTPVTAVGQSVGWVKDLSPNANHWIASADTAVRPTLQQDSNGKYYLQFNGTSQSLFANPFVTASNGIFTMCVGLNSAAQTTQRLALHAGGTTAFVQALMSGTANGALTMGFRNDAGSGGGTAPVANSLLDGTTRAITSAYQGSGLIQRIRDANARATDGSGAYTTQNQATFNNTLTTINRAALGSTAGTTPGAWWQGRIYSGFVINRYLSDADVMNGENWVANRSLAAKLPGQS